MHGLLPTLAAIAIPTYRFYKYRPYQLLTIGSQETVNCRVALQHSVECNNRGNHMTVDACPTSTGGVLNYKYSIGSIIVASRMEYCMYIQTLTNGLNPVSVFRNHSKRRLKMVVHLMDVFVDALVVKQLVDKIMPGVFQSQADE